MDRLRLVNANMDIPLGLYGPNSFDELDMRHSLLFHRQRENKRSLEGAPPYYYRWIHRDEWEEHYDMPRLQSYMSIDMIHISKCHKYHLIKFLNPTIYRKKVEASPRMCLQPHGTPSKELRFFNRTFANFLGRNEARTLCNWIDQLLDDYEDSIAKLAFNLTNDPDSDIDDDSCSSNEKGTNLSDDSIDLFSDSDSDCDIAPPTKRCRNIYDPPRDPRLDYEDLTSADEL